MRRLAAVAIATVTALGCSGTPIRYYQPRVIPEEIQTRSAPEANVVLSVEAFAADAAYDDQRIVYRTSPYRFDYYHFHRWSSSPGIMVSVLLREGYRRTGLFRAVIGGLDARARALLAGRVVAIEEVDDGEGNWQAHVAVELTLRDNMTGEVLWNQLVEERAPVKDRSPEGVTVAVSTALSQIAAKTAPIIARDAARVRAVGEAAAE